MVVATTFRWSASSADKDMASVRHQLYKYNDGATGWELQRLINGYNDRRDRAWPPCQITNMKNKFLGDLFSGVGLGFAEHGGESRVMVRADGSR